jgi:hypothetical protein
MSRIKKNKLPDTAEKRAARPDPPRLLEKLGMTSRVHVYHLSDAPSDPEHFCNLVVGALAKTIGVKLLRSQSEDVYIELPEAFQAMPVAAQLTETWDRQDNKVSRTNALFAHPMDPTTPVSLTGREVDRVDFTIPPNNPEDASHIKISLAAR